MAERKRAAVSSDSSSSGTSDSESSEDEVGPRIPDSQEQGINV